MSHSPDFDSFCRLSEGVQLVPVYRRLLSDMLTPVTALRRVDTGRCACLFESVVGGERVGRYSFVAAGPFFEFEARGNRITLTTLSGDAPRSEQFDSDDPLEELKRQVNRWRSATLSELPPFCSGAVGYAGYDAVRYVEHLPDAPADDRGLPDLAFAFFDHMLVFDNITKTMTVVAMARLEEGKRSPAELQSAYQDACRRVDALVEQLATGARTLGRSISPLVVRRRWRTNRTSPARHSRPPSSTARSTFKRATFSRSCSASG